MTAIDPGTGLGNLEQERDFLLRSLQDLDAERDAGDIDDADYRRLTDDYTARTAAVLRTIEAAKAPRSRMADRRPGPEPSMSLAQVLQSRRRWRRGAISVVIAAFGAVSIWGISQSSGSRGVGQTATGNRQLPGAGAGAGASPSTIVGGVDPRFAQASDLVNQGKVTDAIKLYDAILVDNPSQPVALANDGWLLAQAGLAASRSELVDAGLARIVQAEKVDTTYAAAHFFRGFIMLRAKNDPAGAVTEFRIYLGSVDPSSPEVAQVKKLLDDAIKQAGPNVPPGPNAPPTTAVPPAP